MKLHIVPARTGLAWVKLGIRAFWRQPMALAALFFMTMAAMSLATMIPLVGPAVALALLPSATLAMMVAAAEAAAAREKESAERRAAAEKAEAERRQKDIDHRGEVHRAALAGLTRNGIDEATGRAIIKLIVGGKVPHVTINY